MIRSAAFFLLSLTLSGAPQTQATDATKPAEAEDKAFTEAGREKEPQKKVALWQAFLDRYPSSDRASTARRELIQAAFALNPADAESRVERFERQVGGYKASALWRQLATEYLNAGKDYRKAEKAAQRALRLYSFDGYAAEAREEAVSEKRPAPEEARLRSNFESARVNILETIGEARLKQGKDKQAEAVFREALTVNPSASRAALSLASLFEKRRQPEAALPLAAQSLLSRATPEARQTFATLYARVHGGTDGSEDYLDRQYHRLFPAPIHAEPYKPSAQRTDRVVLAEVYTGAGCPPCVAADLAFDATLERYRRQDVAVVMFHEHIPRPDPLTNADTIARWKWLQGRGVPTYAIDGQQSGGGGPRGYAADIDKRNREIIEKRLEVPAAASLQLTAEHSGPVVRVRAKASDLARNSPDLALHVVLVEKLVRYSGENGIRFHPMVVRGHAAFELKDAPSKDAEHTFDLAEVEAAVRRHLDEFEKYDERHNKDGKFRFAVRPETIDRANLAVVAWIQDQKTREVYQAAWADASKTNRTTN